METFMKGKAMNRIVKRNNVLPRAPRNLWDTDFFDDFFGIDAVAAPAMNVVEKKGEFDVDLSVPGFDKKDITIEVDKNVLTISAQNKTENEEKDNEDRVIRQEFFSSSFERSFVLPENIDTAHISAKQDKGVLRISLPKKKNAPEDKIKKVAVN